MSVSPAIAAAEQLAADGVTIIRDFLDAEEVAKLTDVLGQVYDVLGIHADFLDGELSKNLTGAVCN